MAVLLTGWRLAPKQDLAGVIWRAIFVGINRVVKGRALILATGQCVAVRGGEERRQGKGGALAADLVGA